MHETMQEGTNNLKDLSITNEEMDKKEESLKNGRIVEALFLPRDCFSPRLNISILVDLNLSDCKLTILPKSFATLRLLSYLNLDNTSITHLSPVICELTNLKKLWLRKNFIKDIPDNFGDLTKLEVLFLSKNGLKDLPASCSNLNNLEILCLRDNWFQKIPECIRNGMKQLKNLVLLGNQIFDLDVPPASIQITSFGADGRNCDILFPVWILTLKYKHLETVSLSKMRFKFPNSCFPTEVSYVKNFSMKRCNCTEDDIRKIISRMIYLEELIIENTNFRYGNSLIKFPLETKRNRSSLKQLTISFTELRMIPNYIQELENLSNLDLNSNNIYSLPEEICNLHNLVCLTVESNHLTSLPRNIGNLTSLKELRLRHNHLDKLPESFKFLKVLEYLDLYDNDLEYIPEVVCELTGLVRLDLEQNYFSISDNHLWRGRTVCYKHMRDALRGNSRDVHRYSSESLCGPKREINVHSEETESSSNSFSFYDKEECNVSVTYLSKTETETRGSYNEDEYWDSEDSAEEFDPYETKEPRKCSYSPFTFYKPFQEVYCPGEFHESSVITRVTQMLQNGTLIRPLEYEEGQFEDP